MMDDDNSHEDGRRNQSQWEGCDISLHEPDERSDQLQWQFARGIYSLQQIIKDKLWFLSDSLRFVVFLF